MSTVELVYSVAGRGSVEYAFQVGMSRAAWEALPVSKRTDYYRDGLIQASRILSWDPGDDADPWPEDYIACVERLPR